MINNIDSYTPLLSRLFDSLWYCEGEVRRGYIVAQVQVGLVRCEVMLSGVR